MKSQTNKNEKKYKVGVVFINDRSRGSTLSRSDDQNPMHYRYCPTLKRARHLINQVYGAAGANPVISLADIYEVEKPSGTPPLARWTIEKQWNNTVV